MPKATAEGSLTSSPFSAKEKADNISDPDELVVLLERAAEVAEDVRQFREYLWSRAAPFGVLWPQRSAGERGGGNGAAAAPPAEVVAS